MFSCRCFTGVVGSIYMKQLQHMILASVLFLAVLLQCTQACLTARHLQLATSEVTTSSHDAGPTPCHSTTPPRDSAGCATCQSHAYVLSRSSVVSLADASASVPSPTPVSLSVQPPATARAVSLRQFSALRGAPLRLPRYLSLAVLRL
jgi:hypothetical protein